MLRLALVIACCFASVFGAPMGQENNQTVLESNVACVNKFVKWCQGMTNPSQNSGLSVVSVSYYDGGNFYRLFCSLDSNGTNCTRNGDDWFYCCSNGSLTYDGVMLKEGSAEGVNNDICNATNTAVNVLDAQDTQINQTIVQNALNTYRKSMEIFFNEMAQIQQQLRLLQYQTFGGFPSLMNPSTTVSNNDTDMNNTIGVTTKSSSEIEKE